MNRNSLLTGQRLRHAGTFGLLLSALLLGPLALAQPTVVIEDFEEGDDAVSSCGDATTGAGLVEDAPADYGGTFALDASFTNICVDCPGDGGIHLRTEADVPSGPDAFFNFFLKAGTRPLTVTLFDDDNGNGTFDASDDRFAYEVTPAPGGEWQKVSVPIADFAHVSGDDGAFDPETDGNGGLIGTCFLVDLAPGEGYGYRLDYVVFTEGAALSDEDGAPPPQARSLAVFPNPVSRSDASGFVTFRQPEAAAATLRLYDVRGRAVAVLHDGPLPAGESRIGLDVSALATGTYFVRAAGVRSVVAAPVTVTR